MWLEKHFPNRVPSRTASFREVFIAVGVQDVITKLRHMAKNQNPLEK